MTWGESLVLESGCLCLICVLLYACEHQRARGEPASRRSDGLASKAREGRASQASEWGCWPAEPAGPAGCWLELKIASGSESSYA